VEDRGHAADACGDRGKGLGNGVGAMRMQRLDFAEEAAMGDGINDVPAHGITPSPASALALSSDFRHIARCRAAF
jgi:hypothetical protein